MKNVSKKTSPKHIAKRTAKKPRKMNARNDPYYYTWLYNPKKVRKWEKEFSFDTEDKSISEQDIRIELLHAASKRKSWSHALAASDLADKLIMCAGKHDACGSMACPTCVRRWRINMITAMDRFFPDKPFAFVTLLSKYWVKKDIFQLKAATILSTVRKQFEAASPILSCGPAIGFIDGEYWEKEELFCLHVHIAMPAKYTGKLEKLAYQFYNAERHNGMFSKPKVTMQVTKSKVRLLNYLLKTYWVKKASGKKRDTKDRHRIKGRPHTMYLLWLDQYRISNLRILHNIQFNSKGGIVSSW